MRLYHCTLYNTSLERALESPRTRSEKSAYLQVPFPFLFVGVISFNSRMRCRDLSPELRYGYCALEQGKPLDKRRSFEGEFDHFVRDFRGGRED
jgi:hypothetical protein